MLGRVLVVAGSDSGGGAGIQADIKTITALGGLRRDRDHRADRAGHAGRARRACRCRLISCASRSTVVLDDIGADAVKTGMLGDAAIDRGRLRRRWRARARGMPVVVDPVMVAKGGHRCSRRARSRRWAPAAAAGRA